MVMTRVGVAELKAHLSEHLHAVRAGEVVEVLDRNQPIARIVPLGDPSGELTVRCARGSLHEVALLGPVSGGDGLDQLRQEREERL